MTWGFNDKVNGRRMHTRYGLSSPLRSLEGRMNAFQSARNGQGMPTLQHVSALPDKQQENQQETEKSRFLPNKTSAVAQTSNVSWGFNDRVNGRRMHNRLTAPAGNYTENPHPLVFQPVSASPQQTTQSSEKSSEIKRQTRLLPNKTSAIGQQPNVSWGFNDRVNGRRMHNRMSASTGLSPINPLVLQPVSATSEKPSDNSKRLLANKTSAIGQQSNVSWGFNDKVNGRRMHNRLTPTTQDFNPNPLVLQPVSASKTPEPQGMSPHQTSAESDEYEIAEYGYGKNHVKLLHVERSGQLHTIREYEVDTHLKLCSKKDYLEGNNNDIIATDTQKNTVYILAKKHGVKSPEEFGMLLCSHFLYAYSHVLEASVTIEEYPWERLEADEQPHNHAFVFSPSAYRFCKVTQKRHESPKISGGLRGLRVLKTTQSAFRDFVQDEYRTLPDSNDRIFSTVVTANWDYSTATGVNFDEAWQIVKDCILDKFAGPPDTGLFSPSVQNTLYLAERQILDRVKQIERIDMAMPNKHYVTLDMSVFPSSVVSSENKEVYQPIDKPAGNIHAELKRRDFTSKL